MGQDELVNRRIARIAWDDRCTVDPATPVLDRNPIELDRDKYLLRTLGMELLRLDGLEEAFDGKAVLRDVTSGAQLVKVDERRAILLGLNPPTGHAVAVVQHEPADRPTSLDRIRQASIR